MTKTLHVSYDSEKTTQTFGRFNKNGKLVGGKTPHQVVKAHDLTLNETMEGHWWNAICALVRIISRFMTLCSRFIYRNKFLNG